MTAFNGAVTTTGSPAQMRVQAVLVNMYGAGAVGEEISARAYTALMLTNKASELLTVTFTIVEIEVAGGVVYLWGGNAAEAQGGGASGSWERRTFTNYRSHLYEDDPVFFGGFDVEGLWARCSQRAFQQPPSAATINRRNDHPGASPHLCSILCKKCRNRRSRMLSKKDVVAACMVVCEATEDTNHAGGTHVVGGIANLRSNGEQLAAKQLSDSINTVVPRHLFNRMVYTDLMGLPTTSDPTVETDAFNVRIFLVKEIQDGNPIATMPAFFFMRTAILGNKVVNYFTHQGLPVLTNAAGQPIRPVQLRCEALHMNPQRKPQLALAQLNLPSIQLNILFVGSHLEYMNNANMVLNFLTALNAPSNITKIAVLRLCAGQTADSRPELSTFINLLMADNWNNKFKNILNPSNLKNNSTDACSPPIKRKKPPPPRDALTLDQIAQLLSGLSVDERHTVVHLLMHQLTDDLWSNNVDALISILSLRVDHHLHPDLVEILSDARFMIQSEDWSHESIAILLHRAGQQARSRMRVAREVRNQRINAATTAADTEAAMTSATTATGLPHNVVDQITNTIAQTLGGRNTAEALALLAIEFLTHAVPGLTVDDLTAVETFLSTDGRRPFSVELAHAIVLLLNNNWHIGDIMLLLRRSGSNAEELAATAALQFVGLDWTLTNAQLAAVLQGLDEVNVDAIVSSVLRLLAEGWSNDDIAMLLGRTLTSNSVIAVVNAALRMLEEIEWDELFASAEWTEEVLDLWPELRQPRAESSSTSLISQWLRSVDEEEVMNVAQHFIENQLTILQTFSEQAESLLEVELVLATPVVDY